MARAQVYAHVHVLSLILTVSCHDGAFIDASFGGGRMHRLHVVSFFFVLACVRACLRACVRACLLVCACLLCMLETRVTLLAVVQAVVWKRRHLHFVLLVVVEVAACSGSFRFSEGSTPKLYRSEYAHGMSAQVHGNCIFAFDAVPSFCCVSRFVLEEAHASLSCRVQLTCVCVCFAILERVVICARVEGMQYMRARIGVLLC